MLDESIDTIISMVIYGIAMLLVTLIVAIIILLR